MMAIDEQSAFMPLQAITTRRNDSNKSNRKGIKEMEKKEKKIRKIISIIVHHFLGTFN